MAVTIVRTSWIDDDGTGTTGTVINNAVKTALYNDIDGALTKIPADTQATIFAPTGTVGKWIDVPFAAGDFTTPTGGATFVVTSAGVWAYTLIGKLVVLSLTIASTGTTTGAPVRLQVQLPAAIAAVSRPQQGVPFIYNVGGVSGTGLCSFQGSKLDLLRDVLGTPYGAGGVYLYVTLSFSIT
jgi:hypothetical protein